MSEKIELSEKVNITITSEKVELLNEVDLIIASEKTELLDEVNLVLNPKESLDLNYLIYVLLSIIFVLVVLFPKIYIQQQIYFMSRDVSRLKGEYDTLKEENRLIRSSVESIRFKNQVLDTLF
ncbi:MAG: hypothetical protein PHO62_10665 [Sulfurimonas sp.]|uniref:hypothetical protein n=1 Tax=Sulfurimonas sp. TaxID=2022749 RepID=UPI00263095F8|nr:hypothetical protein [Sulfurimonas sp.]MDD5373872.1 hypothetical protein [Sulfurimonas sp.]